MTLTREELHRMVWARPIVRLAKELGYSHPELVAICKDLNIPRPSGGYWYRLELGMAEDQIPLPPVPAGKPTEIPRGPRKPSEEPATDASGIQTQLNGPEKSESDAGEKTEAKSDAAAEKPDARLLHSVPSGNNNSISAPEPVAHEPIRITREVLYQKVWTMTLGKLVAELETTHVELVRACDQMNIPRPDQSYWSRLHFQLPVEVPLLPALDPGMAVECALRRKGTPKPKSGIQDSGTATAPTLPVKINEPPPKEVAIVPARVEYTREQLYEAVWSTPVVKLAAELGISDVGLAKTCRRMGIPRPPRGYWARVEAGEKLKREPLPAAGPEQDRPVVFRVDQNVARREEWNANHIQAAMHGARCEAVELPPADSVLHEIAERHLKALEKAKPDDKGFVKVEGRNLFPCEISATLGPRLARAVHAIVCELEDRDYEFKAGDSGHEGLQIIRDENRVRLNWSEAKLELEREPTAADKRKPSWTWQLKETKPAGTLSVEISAWGLKGKRKWTEYDGRSLEEVLGVVVEKVEAVFRGHEERRKREAEWAKQREEHAKRAAEQEAIEAEKEARAEKARKERERIKRHEEAKLGRPVAGTAQR